MGRDARGQHRRKETPESTKSEPHQPSQDDALARLEALMTARLGSDVVGNASGTKRKRNEEQSKTDENIRTKKLAVQQPQLKKRIIVEDMRDDESDDEEIADDFDSMEDDDSDVDNSSGEAGESFDDEDDSVDDVEEDAAVSKGSMKHGPPQPEVVVFNDSHRSTTTKLSKSEWKKFMTSDITKMTTTKPVSEKQAARNAQQDREDDENDRNLMELLKTSKLIEQFNAEHLEGKDRKAYLMKKMVHLGAKGHAQEKMPRSQSVAIFNKQMKQSKKELQEAKDLGLYDKSMKNKFLNPHQRKLIEKKRKWTRGGIDVDGGGVGSFRGGILHVSKRKISEIEKSGGGPNRGAIARTISRLDGPGSAKGKLAGGKKKKGRR
ncbi:hypothetical protein BJ742DRAFT_796901 [Cladochytrium replicatum]|nr:hypothetical protein BJ742DRAFT_796901 [Cladochytrium replicatum]